MTTFNTKPYIAYNTLSYVKNPDIFLINKIENVCRTVSQLVLRSLT